MKDSRRLRMIRQLRQHLLNLLGRGDPGHPYIVRAHRLRRAILRSDLRLRNDYLHKTTNPKLHIGGGWQLLEGWLNTDIETISGVMWMDATRRFPFKDETFQYVYSEHMIEHVPYDKGVYMLRECCRVMRRGGAIRMITPDLSAILGLHSRELSAEQEQYLQWFCQTFVPERAPSAASAINAMFRLWGHQFIYDEQTLAGAMRSAGFNSITRYPIRRSGHPELQNLVNEQRYPEGLLNYESVTLEGIK
jgi:predicted SAM-dependent methyltransferase